MILLTKPTLTSEAIYVESKLHGKLTDKLMKLLNDNYIPPKIDNYFYGRMKFLDIKIFDDDKDSILYQSILNGNIIDTITIGEFEFLGVLVKCMEGHVFTCAVSKMEIKPLPMGDV